MEEAWGIVINKLQNFKMKKGIHSFVNPFSMLKLSGKNSLAKGVDYWYVDGISLVNRINSKFDKNLERYSFDNTSLAPIVFSFARENDLKIAIIGTKEEYIKTAVNNISKAFNVSINYYRNGYFLSEVERDYCLNFLLKESFDLVLVGMGTPYQESFLIDLKARGWNGYGFTCGGYLHQISRKENYYPVFFDKMNIRWLYRIFDEPKLFWRYAIHYPNFFLKFKRYSG